MRFRRLPFTEKPALLLLPGLLYAGLTGIAACSGPSAGPAVDPPAPNAALPTVEVRSGTVQRSLLLDGELRAVRSLTIFCNVRAELKITYLPPEGSLVHPGDRLVELDRGSTLNKIKEVEEKIVAADNEIVQVRSGHEAALRDLDVELSRLWLTYEQAKIKAAIPAELLPRREYQENQLVLEKARTEHENQLLKIEQKRKEQAADLQVRVIQRESLDGQLTQARNELGGLVTAAPAAGLVTHIEHWDGGRKLQVGDMVWGGMALVRLPDPSQMEIVAQVNEVDGPRLSVGQQAIVRLDSHPDLRIPGVVQEISQVAIRATRVARSRVFRAVFSLQQTDPEFMKPGMSAQVSVVTGESPAGLLVPRGGVLFEGFAASVVRLEEGGQKRPVAVTILAGDALDYLVADNGALRVGDRILARTED